MNMELIAWLGRHAGTKVAESFILPPRKVTPRSRNLKPNGPPDFDEEGGPSQAPHRYGVTKRSAKGEG